MSGSRIRTNIAALATSVAAIALAPAVAGAALDPTNVAGGAAGAVTPTIAPPTVAAPTIAAPNSSNQAARAAGVVAAVVQVQRTLNRLHLLSDNSNVEVVTVKRSLNHVLRNARFLNNIRILHNFLNGRCAVAGCITLTNLLNDNNVNISRVVAIDVLSGGDLIVFQR